MADGGFDPHFYDPRAPRPGAAARGAPPAPVVWLVALLGSVGGTVAAFIENASRGMNPAVGILLLVLVAPAVEEICKPLAIVFLLEKRPHWLRSAGEVVVLAVLSAVVFATLENLLYIFVHHPEGGPGFVLFRLTVCTALHVAATSVFAVGLAKAWRRLRARGGGFDIDDCFGYYVTAVIIHGLYNAVVTVLALAGVQPY